MQNDAPVIDHNNYLNRFQYVKNMTVTVSLQRGISIHLGISFALNCRNNPRRPA
jgi:hypothetical protein